MRTELGSSLPSFASTINQLPVETNELIRGKVESPIVAIRPITLVVAFMLFLIFSYNLCLAQQELTDQSNLFPGTRRSEITFEALGLVEIPIREICQINNGSSIEKTIVNALNLANNLIKTVESNSFTCVAAFLKILILKNNQIANIRPDAFGQLESVQVLLLENNLLTKVPSKDVLAPMKSLRHLNLADNRIEVLEGEHLFGPSSSNLISLNLKGNPVKRVASNALLQLVRLRTLTLSQGDLKGQMVTLQGLKELRFYHLDRNANLQSLQADLCQSSSRLSSLVMKSNKLERIPLLKECPNLLLLDLSYNAISGKLARNFTQFPQLIDLYLGFNQINSIAEDAFVGLQRLQVLDLSNNHLTLIHPMAFSTPELRATIYDLNIANNKQLASFRPVAPALDRLISLKAFGNPQLKELPRFKSALVLALTYAYHCCDYATDSLEVAGQEDLADESPPIIYKMASSITAKLRQLLSSRQVSTSGDQESAQVAGRNPELEFMRDLKAQENVSEIILWPSLPQSIGSRSFLELDGGLTGGNFSPPPPPPPVRAINRRRSRREFAFNTHLIDELVTELAKIRIGNGVGYSQSAPLNVNHDQSLEGPAPIEQSSDSRRTLVVEMLQEALEGNLRQLLGRNSRRSSRTLATVDQQLTSSSRQFPAETSVSCKPSPSAFFPCRDLFDSWWLRGGIWCVFLFSFAGNILVIIVLTSVKQSSSTSALTSIMWLAHTKRHIDVPRFLVINLAVADLLMALYLGILALVDLNTLGEFKLFAIKWQYSSGCKLAGFLGVLSSELSVFILAIITLERNYAITNAVHLNRRLSLQKAVLTMLFGYLFALGMAVLPLNGIGDYRKYSICLPLDVESSFASQIYVVSLLAINTFSFLLLLSCYLRMYCAIRGSQAWNTNDLRIAKRMSILVVTDFLCWSPIIIAGICSLFGHYIIGTNGLKVLTIFVLPLNSVANPFLYAITTKKFKRDLRTLTRRAKSLFPFNCCCCCSANSKQKDFENFANYNYKHNLVMMQSQRGNNNNNHARSNNKRRRPLSTAAAAAAGRQIEEPEFQQTFHGGAVNRRRQQTLASRVATGNQVTVNKTTYCSCQQQQQLGQLARDTTLVEPSCSGQKASAIRPRIVLEAAIEPALNVALAPCGLVRKSHSNLVVGNAREFPHDGEQNLAASQNEVRQQISRPISRLETGNGSGLNVELSSHQQQSSSCLEVKDYSGFPSKRNYLSVSANVQPEQNILTARSASACGYRQHAAAACCSACNRHQRDPACCTGSYDPLLEAQKRSPGPMRTTSGVQCKHCRRQTNQSGEAGGAKVLARSISRLLFSPLAKAWSSIQISFSSSALYNRDHSPDRAHVRRDLNNSENDKIFEWDRPTIETNYADEVAIDDILQMSPKSRFFRGIDGRRMSRSCEMVTSQLVSPVHSSGAGPTTSTSQTADYYDDKRILLATINRIAGKGSGVVKNRQQAGQEGLQEGLYPRASCKRCRSWSPALLGKLEDCFNQIKCKIPGMTKAERGDRLNEQTTTETGYTQSSSFEQSLGREDDAFLAELAREEEEEEEGELKETSNMQIYDKCETSRADREEEESFGSDDDEFSDRIDDFKWAQKRRATMLRLQQSRRKQSGELQQYSSINSDSLSTKTERTMLVNMSVSIDSNTNIPAGTTGTQTTRAQSANDQ